MRGLFRLAQTEMDVRRRIRIWARNLNTVLETGDLDTVTSWIDSLHAHPNLGLNTETLAAALSESMSQDAVVNLCDAWRSATPETKAMLIRVVAFFTEVRPLRYGDVVKFVGTRGRDEDYAEVFKQLSASAEVGYRVRMVDRRPVPESTFPPNGRLRRAAGSVRG